MVEIMNVFTKLINPSLLGKAYNPKEMTFAVKANIACGHQACLGSPSLHNWTPTGFSPVVRRLLDSGHRLVGITNMHELAYGITSENPAYGDVENARKPGYIAGGSSGGSAAAACINTAFYTLGTDTGGSMLIPAALCGVVGYRPTTGLYGAENVCPLSSSTDTIGVFANFVYNIQLVHKCIVPSYEPQRGSLKNIRVGIPRRYYYSKMNEEMERMMDRAIQAIADAGVEPVEVDVPFEPDSGIIEDSRDFVSYEMNQVLPKYLEEHNCPLSFEELVDKIEDTKVKEIVSTAHLITKERYDQCKKHMDKVREQMDAYFADNKLDCFFAPTTVLFAVKKPSPEMVSVRGGQTLPIFTAYVHNTIPQAVSGVPCISIPCSSNAEDCPFGIMLVAPRGRDNFLLDLANAVQFIMPGQCEMDFYDFRNLHLKCELKTKPTATN